MLNKEPEVKTQETEKKNPSLEQKISDMNTHMSKLNDATFLKALKLISSEVGGDFSKIKDSEFFSNLLSEIQRRRSVFDSRLTDQGKQGVNEYIDAINSRLGLAGDKGLAKFGNTEKDIKAEAVPTETVQPQATERTEGVVPNEAPEAVVIENPTPDDGNEVTQRVEQALTPEAADLNIVELKSDLGAQRSSLVELESTFVRISIIGKKYETNPVYVNLYNVTNSLSEDLQSSLTAQLNAVDQILNSDKLESSEVVDLIKEIESNSVTRYKDRLEKLIAKLVDLLPFIDIKDITQDINSIIAELEYGLTKIETVSGVENKLANQYL